MYSIINSIVLVIASVYMFTSDLPVHNDILCSTVVAFQTDVLNHQKCGSCGFTTFGVSSPEFVTV